MVIRDSYNTKLFEVIRLSGESEIFDYTTGERFKVNDSDLVDWLTTHGILSGYRIIFTQGELRYESDFKKVFNS